ncbi:MAG: hypothetical protein M1472_03480 [Planctomycetes bacterium]|nr:hypothetical protein [Planctomycetota bacterium]
MSGCLENLRLHGIVGRPTVWRLQLGGYSHKIMLSLVYANGRLLPREVSVCKVTRRWSRWE